MATYNLKINEISDGQVKVYCIQILTKNIFKNRYKCLGLKID